MILNPFASKKGKLSVSKLREKLAERGLSLDGSKETLITRLEEAENAEHSDQSNSDEEYLFRIACSYDLSPRYGISSWYLRCTRYDKKIENSELQPLAIYFAMVGLCILLLSSISKYENREKIWIPRIM